MDCAQHFYTRNDIDAAGDALLLCIGILKQKSPVNQNVIATFFRTTPSWNSHLDNGQLRRFRQITLRAAFWALSCEDASPCYDDLSHAVLTAIYPVMQDECIAEDFQVTHAIHLLGLPEWPEGSDLIYCPLSEIQFLVLSVVPAPEVNNPMVYSAYFHALIHFMGVDQPSSLRSAALRIVNGTKQDLVMITAPGVDVSLRDMILSELSPALLTAAFHGGFEGPSIDINNYLQIIFTLAKGSDWLPILIKDGHIERCIKLIGIGAFHYDSGFYLAGILLSVQGASLQQATTCCSAITNDQWWELMIKGWQSIEYCDSQYSYRDDGVEILASLLKGTEMHMPQHLPQYDFATLNSKSLYGASPSASVISSINALHDMIRHKHHEGVEKSASSQPPTPVPLFAPTFSSEGIQTEGLEAIPSTPRKVTFEE
ncbi:hypothetical protein M405DRAFT_229586 [Rhizopogon salebrosus TDB-379]|nr:hypothetical protein M405DRAFT_229586 [Rhizopogon salebrosus TDB-379]